MTRPLPTSFPATGSSHSAGSVPPRVIDGTYPHLLPPVNPDEIGRLGSYRVLRWLGEGGMGLVFQAEDVALCRPVALKVMKSDLQQDVCGWKRFLREARVMASIQHESLVTIYQVGQEGEIIYLAMELLKGLSLEQWMRQHPQPPLAAILRIAAGIARGLMVIHQHGLVHRDIKPSNLWVEQPGNKIKLLDFGLARLMNDDASITQSGLIVGTPNFMSPEQARSEPVCPRSDLFSLGCVLYTLCTGMNPFEGNSITATLTALAVHTPCPVRQLNPGIPSMLSALIMRLLAKKPEDRPVSAEVVLRVLQKIERRQSADPGTEPLPSPGAAKQLTEKLSRRVSRKTPALGSRRKKRTRERLRASRHLLKVGLAVMTAAVIAVFVAGGSAYLSRPGAQGAAPVVGEQASAHFLDELEVLESNLPPLPPAPPGLRPGEVRVRGQGSVHSIFMHPLPPHELPAGRTYRLRGEYRTFQADVTQNDGVPPSAAPFRFLLSGDGRLLWRSLPLTSQADAQSCTVSVEGVDRLRLEVVVEGEPFGAHAVWLEPRVSR